VHHSHSWNNQLAMLYMRQHPEEYSGLFDGLASVVKPTIFFVGGLLGLVTIFGSAARYIFIAAGVAFLARFTYRWWMGHQLNIVARFIYRALRPESASSRGAAW